jgi:phage shock protein C
MNINYALDKSNGKLFGVCAGLARTTGWDPMLIRIIAVVLTVFLTGPLLPVAYVATALVAESR